MCVCVCGGLSCVEDNLCVCVWGGGAKLCRRQPVCVGGGLSCVEDNLCVWGGGLSCVEDNLCVCGGVGLSCVEDNLCVCGGGGGGSCVEKKNNQSIKGLHNYWFPVGGDVLSLTRTPGDGECMPWDLAI